MKMCDVGKTRFFRPWNFTVGDEEPNTDLVNKPTTVLPTINNNVSHQVNQRMNVKCELLMTDNEDSNSVMSSLSGATSATGSYHRNIEHDRRPSVSSSCSVNSGYSPEPLDVLGNFVFGTRNGMESAPRTTAQSLSSSSSSSSISEVSSRASSLSPKSAFTSPTPYQYPVYSAIDYFSPIGMVHQNNVAAAAAASIEANYNNSHQQQLFYGLPGIAMGAIQYPASVEEAVKYIHQQDAAAKRIKKMRPKKFRCKECDVGFSNNGQLKGHVRIHTGERPFHCDAKGCGKSFTRNEELTRHKRIHTGLRPHGCVICGKKFGRKDHLKKHTRTHENRGAYHMPASVLGPYALSHHQALQQGHPMASYMYPM